MNKKHFFILLLLVLEVIYLRSEREKAYRRGLVIGGLMEEARETQPTGTDPQHLIEQVMIEQTIIERLHHSHDNDAPGDQHH